MKRLVSEENSESGNQSPTLGQDPEGPEGESYPQDEGSDDEGSDGGSDDSEDDSYDALNDRFHALEEEVATLVADVHDLALYTKLNITGFMKILKVRVRFFYPL